MNLANWREEFTDFVRTPITIQQIQTGSYFTTWKEKTLANLFN